MKPLTQITLRTATSEDVEFIAGLIEATTRSYIEQTWGAFSRKLTEETVSRAVSSGTYSIVELEGEDVGALAVEHESTHIQLAQIYIVPSHQNRGIGTHLVRSVAANASRDGKPLRVRVLAGNPARRLYEREGFVATSVTPERVFLERPPSTSTTELARHLQSLEQRLLAADVRTNANALECLLHYDFVEFGSSGRIFDKRSTITALSGEAPHEYTMSDFRMTALCPEVALVTYRLARRGSPQHRAIETLRSSIWKLDDGVWKMTFHQGTQAYVL
jgi:glyoxylase I family protein